MILHDPAHSEVTAFADSVGGAPLARAEARRGAWAGRAQEDVGQGQREPVQRLGILDLDQPEGGAIALASRRVPIWTPSQVHLTAGLV